MTQPVQRVASADGGSRAASVARFLIPKILQCLFVVWATYTVAFLLIHALPGDPVLAALSLRGGDATSTDPAELDALRARYGFDGPLWQQYFSNLFALVRGDFGTSIATGQPVGDMIGRAFPHTIAVALFALVLGFLIALAFTVWAYVARPAWMRDVVAQIPPLGIAIPAFLSGLVLITVFSFGLRLFPSTGANGPIALVLPTLALGVPVAATLSQVMRDSLEKTLDEPFIVTVRARGAGEFIVRVHHALRHSLVSAITLVGWLSGTLIGGAVIVEQVFSRPGIGRMVFSAVINRDMPVVLGIVIIAAVFYVVVNTIIDLLYPVIDPRLRS